MVLDGETIMATRQEAQSSTLDAMYQRRAVRAYKEEKLGEDSIRRLLDAAVHAPTAMHLEPWAFVVIQNKEVLKRYSDRAKSMLLAQAQSDAAKEDAIPLKQSYRTMLADPAFNIFYDAGTLIVVCRTMSGPFTDADCWLAAENLMLAATATGLGTCCIGFAVGVLNEPDVKRELGIPAEGAAVAPIIVGSPRAEAAPVGRKAPVILGWRK